MRPLTALSALLFWGCAATVNRGHSIPSTSNQYAISFHQPSSREFGNQAHYNIHTKDSDTVIGRIPSEIKVDERGVDDRPMIAGRDFKPSAISSQTGRTIIITEDCWDAVPFHTYLIVRLSDNRIESGAYRNIPRHSTSPGPIYGYSTVVESLTDHEVSVSYGDGTTKRFTLDSLPPLTPETPRS